LGKFGNVRIIYAKCQFFFKRRHFFFQKAAVFSKKVALDDESVTFLEQQKALATGEALFAKADAPIERRMEKPFTVSS